VPGPIVEVARHGFRPWRRRLHAPSRRRACPTKTPGQHRFRPPPRHREGPTHAYCRACTGSTPCPRHRGGPTEDSEGRTVRAWERPRSRPSAVLVQLTTVVARAQTSAQVPSDSFPGPRRPTSAATGTPSNTALTRNGIRRHIGARWPRDSARKRDDSMCRLRQIPSTRWTTRSPQRAPRTWSPFSIRKAESDAAEQRRGRGPRRDPCPVPSARRFDAEIGRAQSMPRQREQCRQPSGVRLHNLTGAHARPTCAIRNMCILSCRRHGEGHGSGIRVG
jgi:hypothetical protein